LEGTFGGTWSSSNTTISTVDASGDVTGVNPGIDTIYYTVTNLFGCTGSVSIPDTVHVMPSAGAITAGTTVVCAGATITFTESATDGAWSSSDPAIATVSSTGVVTGLVAGTTTISYIASNAWCSAATSVPVNVNPSPLVSAISGSSKLCEASSTTLTDAVLAGTWTSSNTTIAVIGSSSGVVTGLTPGIDTITYSLTNAYGCTSTATLVDTVNITPSSSAITAATTAVCPGDSILFTDATLGGAWSSGNNAIATVDAAGEVTGVAAGTVNIYYAVSNGTCSVFDSVAVNVNTPPTVGAIVGPTSLCLGSTTSITDAVYGGTWSASNGNIGISSTSGIAVADADGVDTIYYTVTNILGCSTTVSQIDTVLNAPRVAAISGSTSVCLGSTSHLTDATTGGTWSTSASSIADVNTTGTVSGVTLGSATIYYTVVSTTGCNGVASLNVTVNPNPSVGLITGASSLCDGATTTLYDDSTGGIWSSKDTAVATIDNTLGTVVGVRAGTDSIFYTVYNGFGCSATIGTLETVNPLPAVGTITGSRAVCFGSTTTLTDTTAGGTWSSTNTSVATITGGGVMSGVADGTTTISYSVVNGYGCLAAVTALDSVVNAPSVDSITGATHLCAGSTAMLSDGVSGGVWTSGNTSLATVDSSTGMVTGVSAGNATIIYTVFNGSGCSAFVSIVDTILPSPLVDGIVGTVSNLCIGGSTGLTDAIVGGTWATSNSGIATVNSSGVVIAVARGIDTISYSITGSNGCVGFSDYTISVDTLPDASILPATGGSICHGDPVNLVVSTATTGLDYQWYDGGHAISGATNQNYIADSAGTYSVEIMMGACSFMLTGVTVVPQPDPSIGLTTGDVLYTDTFTTYQWLLNGNPIAGATSMDYTESAAGNYQVIVTNMYGCTDTSGKYTIFPLGVNNVTNSGMIVKLYPNPTTAEIHIEAPETVDVSVTTIDGKQLMFVKATNTIDMGGLANGVYMIMVYNKDETLLMTTKVVKTE